MPTSHEPTLRDARLKARLSQDELSARSGVERSHLSRAERGYHKLRPELEARLLEVCNAAIASANEVNAA